MNLSAHSLLITLVALMCAGVETYAASDVSADEARLLGYAGESKNRVYWTCRLNACRVNIAFTNGNPPKPIVSENPAIIPTQVWVLRADGSSISGRRAIPSSIGATNFEFPLSAQEEAFAVVVRIGDKLHTWWLTADAGGAK